MSTSIYYLHVAFLVSSLTLLAPSFIVLASGGDSVCLSLLLYGSMELIVAVFWRNYFAPSRRMTLSDAILVAVMLWLLVPILSSIPIMLVLGIPFVDAWFEGVSGFTTTGLTIFTGSIDPWFNTYVPRIEELPPSIQLWRSFTQWIGGIGILALFAAFAAGGALPAHVAGLAEGRYEHILPSVARSLRAFTQVYFIYTFIGVLLFMLAGMNFYDALNHAMTGIATGGFSTHSQSFAYYNNVFIEASAIIVMILGALNFADHYDLVRGRPRRILRNPETAAFFLISSLAILLSMLIYAASKGLVSPVDVRGIVFQVISSISGTGFQTIDLSRAPQGFLLLLSFTNILGGSILSTTGGIKLFRLIVLTKSVTWNIETLLSSSARIVVRRVGDRVFRGNEVEQAVSVAFLFIVVLLAATLISAIFLPHKNIVLLLFEASSALGNVGLSTGITGASLPVPVKIIYIVLMLLGRLEILSYVTALMILRERARLRWR